LIGRRHEPFALRREQSPLQKGDLLVSGLQRFLLGCNGGSLFGKEALVLRAMAFQGLYAGEELSDIDGGTSVGHAK